MWNKNNNNKYNKFNQYNNNKFNYSRGFKKKYKNYYNSNYDGYNQNLKEEIGNTKVIKSDEEGFTGPCSNWFSNEEFFKNLPGHSDIESKKDYYFNSYSSYNIHEEMLKDRIRTGTYSDAILQNPEIFKDKVVLDIGCGTGILSMFAAKSGAKQVIGLEFADIADYAKQIVKINNLEDKITIIKSKVEEAVLPVEKVDIIISEWMGYFLLYESMLDTVLFARDKWLKEDGYMLPDTASITIAGIEDIDYKTSKFDFWKNVYGFDMSIFKPTCIAEPLIDICPKDRINTNSCRIFDIDLYKVKKEELDFSSKYSLKFNRNNDYFSGLVAWFETGFTKLNKKFNLNTSPYLKGTHWQQTVFYTKNDIPVRSGDVVEGSIAVRKSETNFRQLDIKISYNVKYDGKDEDKERQWVQMYKIV
jgi:protein arginine N-methyltransferase 1